MNYTVEQLFEGFSFEATTKDVAHLDAVSHKIMPPSFPLALTD